MIKLFRFALSSERPTLQTKVQAVQDLTVEDQAAMLSLMQKYYAQMEDSEFYSDLAAKDDVIILRESRTGKLVGFSTLTYFDLSHLKERAFGVFSGDTIVDQAYWGNTALQKTFLLHLSRWKLKNRGQLFWFLISKGYKTYLLMANNFPLHYPRFEAKTPELYQEMMAEVYGSLYPQTYRADLDLIQNAGHSYHLKEGVAAPSPALLRDFPRIRYFVEKNRRWSEGDELACIAEMHLGVLFLYLIKAFKKTIARPTLAARGERSRKRSFQDAT
jgi:hypothetical protein